MMRAPFGLLVAAYASVLACGCSSSAPSAHDPVPYLDDASYRHAELAASIVNPENSYSALRLEHYSTGTSGDWDRLLEWNPATEPVEASELDADGGASPSAFRGTPSALTLPASVSSEDDPALIALGREAFSRYPVQLAPYFEVGLASRAAAAQYGLWTDNARGVGGLVRARMGDGTVALAVTCSSCHAAPSTSGIDDGRPNAAIDVGAAVLAAAGGPADPSTSAALAAWGPGRLDVMTTAGTYPERIPDLRPTTWLTYLHQEGTLAARDRTALAIRIETLIITSNGQALRPPRVIALALAAYLASLSDALPSPLTAAEAQPRGAQLFATECASCHAGEGLTGDPVPLDVVGTDPWLGESPDRGTGAYRVPSLRGVGTRGPLLHDATVPSIAALLDPTRPTPSFEGRLHGAGAVQGHLYGLDLAAADRAALVAYLEAL
jgi:mono/diheme cytochrome c family protein